MSVKIIILEIINDRRINLINGSNYYILFYEYTYFNNIN
mgnify:CR=1 FL=1